MCDLGNPLLRLNQALSSNSTQQPHNAYTLSLMNIPPYSKSNLGRSSILGTPPPFITAPEFSYQKELKTIQDILKQDFSQNTRHRKTIPNKSEITINQGVYVDCACLIVDMRKSSDLTNYHRKPQLAKLYQTFISSVIRILKDEKNFGYINIVGDGVQGFFNTNSTNAYENVLTAAAKINSFTTLINQEFIKHNIVPISIGIGISAGSVLMTKVGTGVHTDIVWIGDVVNKASKLCDIANKEVQTVAVSQSFYEVIPQKYLKDFTFDYSNDCYHSNFIDYEIDNYVGNNGQTRPRRIF